MDAVLYLIVFFVAFEILNYLEQKNRAFVAKLMRRKGLE